MKILIISKGFYPDISPRSFRATELAKEFSLQGHKVTIMALAGGENQYKFVQDNGLKLINIPEPRINIPFVQKLKKGGLPLRAISRLFEITLDYPSNQYKFIIETELKKMSEFDLIISIAVPHTIHWGVAAARRRDWKLTKIWIADCGDPYLKVES